MHVAWRVDRPLSGRGLPFTLDYFGAPRSHRYESVTYSGFSGSHACRSYLRGKKVDYPTPRSLSRPDVPILASTILCSPRSPPLF